MIRRIVRSLAILAAVSCLAVLAWWSLRDPLQGLPRLAGPLSADILWAEVSPGRRMEHLRLSDRMGRGLRVVVSRPDPLPESPLPVLMVLGGLRTGAQNIAAIEDPGSAILIGYDWPIPTLLPRGWELAVAAPALRRAILQIPDDVAGALAWVLEQDGADRRRVSLLGFSLGALAAPAVQRVTQARGIDVGWTVLAYGGAPVGDLLQVHPRAPPAPVAGMLAWAIDVLLRPVEPLHHLPHLKGRFLLLAGKDDQLIPEAPARRLREAVPEPKTVVLFEGDHMGTGPEQRALLERIVQTSRAWLVANGAVD